MIRHSVILKFKELISSSDKDAFFEAANKLAHILGVHELEILDQISAKNPFEFGISMEFDSQEEYDHYTIHPAHIHFIQNFWMKNVKDFLEIDFKKNAFQ